MLKSELLAILQAQVEHHIGIAKTQFRHLSEADLFKKSTPEGWNVAQCLEHLNSYSNFYFPIIKQKLISISDTNQAYSNGWLGAYFIKSMQKNVEHKKYKALKKHLPKPQTNAISTIQTFIQTQEEFLLLLKKSQKCDLNQRIATSISSMITLKLGDILQFLVAHNERHLQQARRCLS